MVVLSCKCCVTLYSEIFFIFSAIRKVNSSAKISFFFVPYKTHEVSRMLADQKNIYFTGEYHLDMIPLDSDLISLQSPQSFKVFVQS